MKLIRKPLCLLLALIMLLSVNVPLTVFADPADAHTVTVEPFRYSSTYGDFSQYIDIVASVNGSEVADRPFNAVEGDTVRISSAVKSPTFPCNVTAMSIAYEKNGKEITQCLELERVNRARDVAGEFVMPSSDVSISFTVENVYFVRVYQPEPSTDGTLSSDFDRAIAYDVVTLTAQSLNPQKPDAEFIVATENGVPVDVSDDGTFIMPAGVSVQVDVVFYKKPVNVTGYLRRSWDNENDRVITQTEYLTTQDDVVYMSSVPDGGTLQDGKWYYVNSNVTFNNRIHTEGHVRIVLGDGYTVNFKRGIEVNVYKHLEIFPQKNETGKLIAVSERFAERDDQGEAAIGSDYGTGGNITFHGGNIEAKALTACQGAAIGGAGGYSAGCLTFYAGRYNVRNSGGYSAAIGGGYRGGACRFSDGLRIYGGTFDIYGYAGGAGIGNGAGYNGSEGPISIFGGNITVKGHSGVAAIGGGKGGKNGYIFIYGGEVSAVAYASKITGAAIGAGGEADQGDPIYIYGGTVIAESTHGAGIGGSAGHSGGTVNIRGGIVFASSSAGGAGIGGGHGGGNGGTVDITGGTVIAISSCYDSTGELTEQVTHLLSHTPMGAQAQRTAAAMAVSVASLADVFSDNEYSGAGIGGGNGGSGGTVSITGGTVIAKSGLSSAASIGKGKDGRNHGSLSVGNTMRVRTGYDQNSVTLNTGAYRASNCQRNRCSLIDECPHDGAAYQTVDSRYHRMICASCEAAESFLQHSYDSDGLVCADCGYERVRISFLPGQGGGSMSDVYVTKGGTYTLPANGFTVPEGKIFEGWLGTIGSKTETFPAGTSHTFSSSVSLTAQFADTYKLWVGGVQVSDANKDDILGLGKISFDPASCTLSFDNLTEPLSGVTNGALVYSEGMNLVVTGKATLTKTSGYMIGIHSKTSRGRGSLTVNGDFTITGAQNSAVNSGNYLAFTGGTIVTEADGVCIKAVKNMYLYAGLTKLSAESQTSYALDYDEISVEAPLTVTEYTPKNRAGFNYKNNSRIVFGRGVNITYVLNGGRMNGGTDDVTVTIQKDAQPERPDTDPTRVDRINSRNYHYGFGGWYADEALTTEFDFTRGVSEDTRIYARWTRYYKAQKRWAKNDADPAPDSVRAVLQKQEGASWSTVQTVTLNAGNHWEADFDPVTFKDLDDSVKFRVRELDKDGNVVLASDDQGGAEEPGAVFTANGQSAGFLVSYELSRDSFYNIVRITNATLREYWAEKKWETDIETAAGKQDRPDELQVVLQRFENWYTWKTVQILTLNKSNNWTAKFEAVPAGRINDEDKFEAYRYRIRELKAEEKNENGQLPQYNTDEERLEAADGRVVHDKWDFDKPFFDNILDEFKNPDTYLHFEPELDWLKDKTKGVLIPSPSVEFEVEEYTDFYNVKVEKHTTKYNVDYEFNSKRNCMTITNLAVVDAKVHSWWINFNEEEDPETGEKTSEKPESCYVMLESKVQKDYLEKIGESGEYADIYTPCFSTVSGGYSLSDLPGVSDLTEAVKTGIQKLMGDGFVGKIVGNFVGDKISDYLDTGVAVAKQDGEAQNPLNRWYTEFTVKKYGMGDLKLPMDYAATELVTGLIELVIDAAIKYFGIQNVHVPVMYQPIDGYWSVKGYGIPFGDSTVLCNIINTKFHGDDDNLGTVVSGMKYWKDDEEDDRPDSIQIRVTYDKDGTETELTGTPIEVKKADNEGSDSWPWSVEIPMGDDAADVDIDSFTVEEVNVPNGYDSGVSGRDITNTKRSGDPSDEKGELVITATRGSSGAQREQAFVYSVSGSGIEITAAVVLAAGETSGSVTIAHLPYGDYTVTEEDAWSWRYGAGGSSAATVGANTAEAAFDHGAPSPNWLGGYSHRQDG